MIVTILSSIKNKEKIDEVFEFANVVLGAEKIFYPAPEDGKMNKHSIFCLNKRFLGYIDKSDLVIAIPKNIFEVVSSDASDLAPHIEFGESVTHEMAYTKHTGKPLLIWR